MTIDLNGFTIAASGPSAFGISASVPAVTIRNGIFTGSPMADISLAVGGIIENVQLLGPSATISCAGGCMISGDFFAGSNAPINDLGGSLIVSNVFAASGPVNPKMGTTTEYGNNVFNFAPTITGGVLLGAGNTNLCGTTLLAGSKIPSRIKRWIVLINGIEVSASNHPPYKFQAPL